MEKQNFEITFVQFIRPSGRIRPIHIQVEKKIYDIYAEVVTMGGRFTAEILRTGQISLTCEYNEDDIVIEVVNNGPEIIEAVNKLIEDSYNAIIKILSRKKDEICVQ